MLENEQDFILPDDVDQPQSIEEDAILPDEVEVEETVEDTKPTEETTETNQTELQKLKLKYNSEEREVTVEEAKALAQKGLNYEKAVERAKQEARDAYIAEQGYSWNGKPITTEAEYKQALAEKELMEKYSSLPEDVVKELIEGKKFREQFEAERKQQTEQEQKNKELTEFLTYFKQTEGREYDPDNDKIPQEVWEAHANGVPLKFAYLEHQNKQLQTKLKIQKQNEENRSKAPIGSVTSHGSTEVASEDDFMRGFNSF